MSHYYGGGHFNLYYPSIAVPTTVLSLTCYTVAVEITPSNEEVDVGVFCAPALTDQGRTTYTAVATLLWEPALYTLLQPHVGVAGEAKYIPRTEALAAGDLTQYIRWMTRFAAQPWGRFEVGQRVEVELPLAVLDTPTFLDVP